MTRPARLDRLCGALRTLPPQLCFAMLYAWLAGIAAVGTMSVLTAPPVILGGSLLMPPLMHVPDDWKGNLFAASFLAGGVCGAVLGWHLTTPVLHSLAKRPQRTIALAYGLPLFVAACGWAFFTMIWWRPLGGPMDLRSLAADVVICLGATLLLRRAVQAAIQRDAAVAAEDDLGSP